LIDTIPQREMTNNKTVRFAARINKMGKSKTGALNKVIWIPLEYHKELKAFEGKQVIVTVTDL
jgi:hypothetical protein